MTNLGLIIALILTAIVGVLIETLLKLILPEKPSARHIFTLLVAIAAFSYISVQLSKNDLLTESLSPAEAPNEPVRPQSTIEVVSLQPSPTNPALNFATNEPSPTSAPGPTRTPSPTEEPYLEVSPKDLIPSNLSIPDTMALDVEKYTTNENVAEQYDNPTEIYQLLDNWERDSGYNKLYLNKQGCAAQSGYRQIAINAVLHDSSLGAKRYWNWLNEPEADPSREWLRLENLAGLGESASASWYLTDDDCEPPGQLLTVRIAFTRYNAVGSVIVRSVNGTISEDDMLNLASRIAQLIDLKFVANAIN